MQRHEHQQAQRNFKVAFRFHQALNECVNKPIVRNEMQLGEARGCSHV